MQLDAYLERIGFEGRARPDRETLNQIQRRHLMAIPYESLDVMLGRPLTVEPAAAFDKIVRRRRGGWCYEMNGLMGWALGEIGFRVTRLAGAVMRSAAGDDNIGNHLVLRVDLDEGPVVADVGLGDGPFTPFAVRAGSLVDRELEHCLEHLGDGWWRMHNAPGVRPPDFDFHLELADESVLRAKCAFLQGDPASMFVQTLVCQRFVDDGHVDLMGRVLRHVGPNGAAERVLDTAQDLVTTLATVFDVHEPAAAEAWPTICARHEARLAPPAASAPEAHASSSMSQ